MKPLRIQLRRKKGFRLPPNTIAVTRPGKWGNPFKVGSEYYDFDSDSIQTIKTTDEAVRMFKETMTYTMREMIRSELAGKNVACFCKLCSKHKNGKPAGVECNDCAWCHGDILLAISNSCE